MTDRPTERRYTEDEIVEGTARLGQDDAGELLTLQLASWVREGRDNGTIDIPALREDIVDVRNQLADDTQIIWGFRDSTGRLIATVRTSPISESTVFLGRLGVVPDKFRLGIGSVLLRFAERRLPDSTRRIELVTGANSLGNHAFYARYGYSIFDRDDAQGIVRLAKTVVAQRTSTPGDNA